MPGSSRRSADGRDAAVDPDQGHAAAPRPAAAGRRVGRTSRSGSACRWRSGTRPARRRLSRARRRPRAPAGLVAAVREAGLPCGVILAPVLPWLTDAVEQLDARWAGSPRRRHRGHRARRCTCVRGRESVLRLAGRAVTRRWWRRHTERLYGRVAAVRAGRLPARGWRSGSARCWPVTASARTARVPRRRTARGRSRRRSTAGQHAGAATRATAASSACLCAVRLSVRRAPGAGAGDSRHGAGCRRALHPGAVPAAGGAGGGELDARDRCAARRRSIARGEQDATRSSSGSGCAGAPRCAGIRRLHRHPAAPPVPASPTTTPRSALCLGLRTARLSARRVDAADAVWPRATETNAGRLGECADAGRIGSAVRLQ